MKKSNTQQAIRVCAIQQEQLRIKLSAAYEKFIAASEYNRFLRNFRTRSAIRKVAYYEYNLQRNKNRMKFLVNSLNSKR